MIKQTRLLSAVLVLGTMTLCTASAQASMFSNIQKAVKNAQAQQFNKGSRVSLNPQPIPPSSKFRPGSINALNPQPLPPLAKLRPGSLASLNPQPLPPLAKFTTIRR